MDRCPLTPNKMSERIEKAKALFREGFNCSQSVVAAYADLYGYTPEQALRMSAAFGGGIGRMRMTCGAACGLFMLAGLEKGAVVGNNSQAKADTYTLVQELAAEFKQRNGSLICAELLGLKAPEGSPIPAERTPAYYAKRPCIEMVQEAARIWEDYLAKTGEKAAE